VGFALARPVKDVRRAEGVQLAVLQRLTIRRLDVAAPGEMDDGIGPAGCQTRHVGEDVQLEVAWRWAADVVLGERSAPVEGRHLMARRGQLSDNVSADES
jgi:hypothetical protein